jgi:hypothetical protein
VTRTRKTGLLPPKGKVDAPADGRTAKPAKSRSHMKPQPGFPEGELRRRHGPHPILSGFEGSRLLEYLSLANTTKEWDSCVGDLVEFLLRHWAMHGQSDEALYSQVPWHHALAQFIRAGVAPLASRPRASIRATRDAEYLRKLAQEGGSITDAVDALRRKAVFHADIKVPVAERDVHGSGVAIDPVIRRKWPTPLVPTDEALRKRVKEAEVAGGFKFKRRRPFGRI